MEKAFENELIATAKKLGVSNELMLDELTKFTLSTIWSKIVSEEGHLQKLTGATNVNFIGWDQDLYPAQGAVFQGLCDQLTEMMSSAKPFEDVMCNDTHECDDQSQEIIKKLTEEFAIPEFTITDFDCGSGSRILSIIRYLFDRDGATCLANKDILIISNSEMSMRSTMLQILFHAHKNGIEIGKLAAHENKGSGDFVQIDEDALMTVVGIHNHKFNSQMLNDNHDCVVAETEHVLLLAA